MKINKYFKYTMFSLVLVIFSLMLFGYISYMQKIKKFYEKIEVPVKVSNEEALVRAEEFCKKFNIVYTDKLVLHNDFQINLLSSKINEYYRLHSFFDDLSRPHGIYVACEEKNQLTKNARDPHVYFVVGGYSKDVEMFANPAIYESLSEKYGGITDKNGHWHVKWPAFIVEEKAKKIIDLLASKLVIPEDMFFEKIEKNEKQGVWNAVWIRKKDNYQYEGDAVSLSIMGATGDFVGYTKTYRGIPCPTEVKVSKERALELAWEKLREDLSWRHRRKAKDIYRVNETKLMIIQTNIFRSSVPVKIDGSKLSWIINFYFTGGLVDTKPVKPISLMTEEEMNERGAFITRRENRRFEMGQPEQFFEVRIDAATGDILYVSDFTPWYLRWLLK